MFKKIAGRFGELTKFINVKWDHMDSDRKYGNLKNRNIYSSSFIIVHDEI